MNLQRNTRITLDNSILDLISNRTLSRPRQQPSPFETSEIGSRFDADLRKELLRGMTLAFDVDMGMEVYIQTPIPRIQVTEPEDEDMEMDEEVRMMMEAQVVDDEQDSSPSSLPSSLPKPRACRPSPSSSEPSLPPQSPSSNPPHAELARKRRRPYMRARPKKPVICHICNKNCRVPFELTQHLQSSCETTRPFKCPTCDYRTHNKKLVIHHCRGVHKEHIYYEHVLFLPLPTAPDTPEEAKKATTKSARTENRQVENTTPGLYILFRNRKLLSENNNTRSSHTEYTEPRNRRGEGSLITILLRDSPATTRHHHNISRCTADLEQPLYSGARTLQKPHGGDRSKLKSNHVDPRPQPPAAAVQSGKSPNQGTPTPTRRHNAKASKQKRGNTSRSIRTPGLGISTFKGCTAPSPRGAPDMKIGISVPEKSLGINRRFGKKLARKSFKDLLDSGIRNCHWLRIQKHQYFGNVSIFIFPRILNPTNTQQAAKSLETEGRNKTLSFAKRLWQGKASIPTTTKSANTQ
ncbi:hypothetical protein VTL71DRAFT_2702 [Oculimacula yallundae]|uniref:C2H2-type domain-containing protein n=1 Tax=Oculimacula yallundae TaxID=86028 RepID=A0ABR4CBJ3_9HELO